MRPPRLGFSNPQPPAKESIMSKPIAWIVAIAFGITGYVFGTRTQAAKDTAKRITRKRH